VLERYDYDDYGAVTFLTSDGTPSGSSSSAVGNVYCWNGLRLDTETGLHGDNAGGYFEPQTARYMDNPMKASRFSLMPQNSAPNNPWSSGSGGPVAMKNGTVKFFNEAKGFGRFIGRGNTGNSYAMYGVMK
jgi:hypothetical protein